MQLARTRWLLLGSKFRVQPVVILTLPSMRLRHARKHGVVLGLQRKEDASLSKTLKMEDHMTNGLPI